MTSELWYERLHAALESTRGTAVTTPTHSFNGKVMITAANGFVEPEESRGEIASKYRQTLSRKGAAWTYSEAAVDVNYLPFFLNMAVAPVTTPTTPGGGTNSRLWTFARDMDADDIETATLIWNLHAQPLSSDYAFIDTLTLSNDASGEGGLTLDIAGTCHYPADIAVPTPAASIAGALMPSQLMSLYMDTSSGIGTTEVTGRLISATHVITTGVTYKFLGSGPAGTLEFTKTGRDGKVARCVTTLTLEVPDMTQYDLFTAGTHVKCRVRHNGALIEGSLYNYVQVDTYGVLKNLQWGENAGSNRSVTFTIESIKDSTLGSDYAVMVQNARTTL